MATASDTTPAPAAQRESAPAVAPRRALLGTVAAAVGVITIAGTASTAAETDPHPAWERQCAALLERIRGADLDEDEEEWLYEELERLEGLITDTPARTLAGVLAQVRLALDDVKDSSLTPPSVEERYWPERALLNAIATLETLAGEG